MHKLSFINNLVRNLSLAEHTHITHKPSELTDLEYLDNGGNANPLIFSCNYINFVFFSIIICTMPK